MRAIRLFIWSVALFLPGTYLMASGDAASDWCNTGTVESTDGPWRSLDSQAVAVVSPNHLAEALGKLTRQNYVQLTKDHARRMTELPLESKKGEKFFLARAGILGAPGVTVEEYLIRARGMLVFGVSLSADGTKLLTQMFSTSLPYPSRRIAMVFRTRPTFKTSASRCGSVL